MLSQEDIPYQDSVVTGVNPLHLDSVVTGRHPISRQCCHGGHDIPYQDSIVMGGYPISGKCCHRDRVGHRVLFLSECIVLLRSFKERNVLLHSFFEFLATYETQKNDAFFS